SVALQLNHTGDSATRVGDSASFDRVLGISVVLAVLRVSSQPPILRGFSLSKNAHAEFCAISNFWPLTARLSQCPLRSESDRSAALPRIDAMIRSLATSTACVVYPPLTALRMHWGIFPTV